MVFEEFLGSESFRKSFANSVLNDKLSHAIIIAGPKNTGKSNFARVMARVILCEGINPPCDNCPSCKQALHGNSSSITFISPKTSTFRVEDVNKIIQQVNLKSWSGRKKIIICEQAQSMNPTAQNRLLKTLEEPVGDTALILLCDTLSPLLPTILSRCQIINMPKVNTGDIERKLLEIGTEQDTARFIAGLSDGYWQKALQLANDPDLMEKFSIALNMLKRMKKPGGALVVSRDFPTEREKTIEFLGLWQHILSRCIKAYTKQQVNKQIFTFAKEIGMKRTTLLLDAIIQAEIKLSSTGSVSIVRDSLLCDLEEALQ